MLPTDHLGPAAGRSAPAPLAEVAPAPRRTSAEEARTLVACNRMAALATLSEDGAPWGSLVLYAALQNAASIAKNILTTEAIVAEVPDKDNGGGGGGMPDMGGMGGMM